MWVFSGDFMDAYKFFLKTAFSTLGYLLETWAGHYTGVLNT